MASQGSRIEIKGLEKLTKGLAALGRLDVVKDAIGAGAEHLQGKIKPYPPRKHVRIEEVGGWKSEKQRRWFFAALARGEIDVPYRRGQSSTSEDLGDKWTIKQQDKGLGAVIGNNVSYGIYVQDADNQSKMHELIGWKTTDEVVDQERETVIDGIINAVDQQLEQID